MTDVHGSLKGSFINKVVSPLSVVSLSLPIATVYLKVLKETFKKAVTRDGKGVSAVKRVKGFSGG